MWSLYIHPKYLEKTLVKFSHEGEMGLSVLEFNVESVPNGNVEFCIKLCQTMP